MKQSLFLLIVLCFLSSHACGDDSISISSSTYNTSTEDNLSDLTSAFIPDGVNEELTFDPPSITDEKCSACGECIEDNTCMCQYSDLGTSCYRESEQKVSIQPTSVKSISYNVVGNGLNETYSQIEARLTEIASRLILGEYDIIVLQEVWTDQARLVFLDAFEHVYTSIVFKAYNKNGGLDPHVMDNSGLFIASKFPIFSTIFESFIDTSSGDEAMKGFTITAFDLIGSAFLVVNTQLETYDDENDHVRIIAQDVRTLQLKQMKSLLLKTVKQISNSFAKETIGVAIMGDLNIDESSMEYSSSLTILGEPIDVMKELKINGKTLKFGPNPIVCSTDLNVLLFQIGFDPCMNSKKVVVSQELRLDYILSYHAFHSGSKDTDKIIVAELEFDNESSGLDFNANESNPSVGLPYGGSLSYHTPLSVSFKVPRVFDPSLLIAGVSIGITVIPVLLFMIHKFTIQHENRSSTTDERKAGHVRTFVRQTDILLTKNFTLFIRNRSAWILQVCVPFAFVGFLSLLLIALKMNQEYDTKKGDIKSTSSIEIGNIPRCVVGEGMDDCYTLAYSPRDNDEINIIMNNLADSESIPLDEIISFNDGNSMDDFLMVNPNRVLAAIEFTVSYFGEDIKYAIQYNDTLEYKFGGRVDKITSIQLPIQKAVDRELLRFFSGNSNLVYEPNYKAFPHPSLAASDIIASAGPAFFFGSLMFNFVIQIGQIVQEKEFLLRQGMEVMGLNVFVYWFTWLITNLIMNSISGLLLIAAGFVFQLPFFYLNDPLLYFALFFLFGVSMVAFALFCSLFLSKGRTATSFGFAVYLVGVIVQGFVSLLYSNNTDEVYRIIFSLFPFVLLGQGVSTLAQFSSGTGATGLRWGKRFEDSFFSMNDIYTWYWIDTAVFLVATLILDKYFSNEDPRVFLRYLCGKTVTRQIPCERRDNSISLEVIDEFEKVANDVNTSKLAVRIHQLVKTYFSYKYGIIPDETRDFRAVNGLSLGISEGELLCLLGPNGAGKTTTIKTLTGVHTATGGQASIFGYNVRSKSGMHQIRKMMGVCPQHDILWDDLTAREHLRLFCGFKNIPDHLVEAEVEERLADVNLVKWGDAPSGSYSGGMKRRLSVAIALIGSPKIVFLDEPTTGMDPVSCRQVWDLIERVKKGRVIVLTTHSMEEADILGDRIAIMRNGELTTIGTSIFLKNKYGNGYRLKISYTETAAVNDIVSLVESHFKSDLNISKDSLKKELEIEIERKQSNYLPALVAQLEDTGRKTLGVTNIEMSISTLQEVFLKIAEADERSATDVLKNGDTRTKDTEIVPINSSSSTTPTTTSASNTTVHSLSQPLLSFNKDESGDNSTLDESPRGRASPQYSFGNQMRALLTKSWINQKRSTKTNCVQLLIPVSLIILLYLLQNLVDTIIKNSGGSMPEMKHPPVKFGFMFGEDKSVYDNCDRLTTGGLPEIDDEGAELYFAVEKNDQRDWIGTYGGDKSCLSDDSSSTSRNVEQHSSTGYGLLGNVTKNNYNMLEIRGYVDEARGGTPFLCFGKIFINPIRFTEVKTVAAMDDHLYSQWGSSKYHIRGGYVFEDMDPTNMNFKYTIVNNETLSLNGDLSLYMNWMVGALTKAVSTNPEMNINMIGSKSFPSPPSVRSFDLISLIGPFLYVFIFQLMFPVILGGLVYEKEHSLREVMKMMGLKQHVYWIISYFFSYMLYFVATSILLAIASVLNFRFFVMNDRAIVYLFFFIWGHVLVAFSFFVSVFFTKTRSCTVVGYIYVFAVGIIAQKLVANYFNDPNTPASTLFIVQCVPQFSLYRGLLELSNGVTFGQPGLRWAQLFNGDSNMLTTFTYLGVEWIVLMILAVYLEAVLPSPLGVKSHPLFPLYWLRDTLCGGGGVKVEGNKELHSMHDYLDDEYDDVRAERERVYQDAESSLRVYNLKKTYAGVNGLPDVEAVKNLTIGVSKGECFGFLGSNGAGKSTTMKMLCGYFGPTSGTAKVLGYDIRTDMDSIHMLLGVCPQENVLWEDLTGREHLEFYGRLKGMKGKQLSDTVDYRLGQVDLLSAGDKKAGEYSGGMKRRLCVSIALVGNPQVIILDEPSTGLDPKARNDLWKVIRQASSHAAILLTTHSMEEAENLCTRIGIFMSGRLRCLGTAADLKHRLGDGYFIHAVSKPTEYSKKRMHKYLINSIPGLKLLNSLNGTMNYQVSKEDASLSLILDTLLVSSSNSSSSSDGDGGGITDRERSAAIACIEDWGVENTTLEQVFVEIVKEGGRRTR